MRAARLSNASQRSGGTPSASCPRNCSSLISLRETPRIEKPAGGRGSASSCTSAGISLRRVRSPLAPKMTTWSGADMSRQHTARSARPNHTPATRGGGGEVKDDFRRGDEPDRAGVGVGQGFGGSPRKEEPAVPPFALRFPATRWSTRPAVRATHWTPSSAPERS